MSDEKNFPKYPTTELTRYLQYICAHMGEGGGGGSSDVFWSQIKGNINEQLDLKSLLDTKTDDVSDNKLYVRTTGSWVELPVWTGEVE